MILSFPKLLRPLSMALFIMIFTPYAQAKREAKTIGMWVDANSNLKRFQTEADVKAHVKRIKAAGFNTIYLDVKPGTGYALYDSHILPHLKRNREGGAEPQWDYLGTWLKYARKAGIDLYACVSTLGFGNTRYREGVVYEDHRWDGKTQVMMKNNCADSLMDIRDDQKADAAFLNPTLQEVQDFVVSYIAEIVRQYPQIKGICLDYCRWWNGDCGMSPQTIGKFADAFHLNDVCRNNIITQDGGQGPLFPQWTEFRSMTITHLIQNIRNSVKTLRPDCELQLWAATDWESRFPYGQNWASSRYKSPLRMYTDNYPNTSFAKYIDAFVIGAYSVYALTEEYPNTIWWAVEAAMDRYPQYVMGDCKVIGSVQAYQNYAATKSDGLPEACAQCLKKSDGLMVFELGHVENKNEWEQIKEGIRRARQNPKSHNP